MNELEKDYQEKTKMKNIEQIIFGSFEINTWYFSPYPEEYGNQKLLYICENCLKYMKKKKSIMKHQTKCTFKHPPGEVIYVDSTPSILPIQEIPKSIVIYEVDASNNKLYCQCLCLFAKLFLDHKTMYFDISSFIFYILTEEYKGKCNFVGYFSKVILLRIRICLMITIYLVL